MRSIVFFVAGIVAGAAMTHTGIAQDSSPRALSHVGIAVKNFDEALGYYTKTLGFREARQGALHAVAGSGGRVDRGHGVRPGVDAA